MRQLKKIQSQFQEKLDKVVDELVSQYPRKINLRKLKWYVTDTCRGRAYHEGQFTVPLWAYKKGDDYFKYYTAHELAHYITFKRFGKNHSHDAKFYNVFIELCPKHLQYHELKYKKTSCKYGIKKY
jgi:predicted SprT family Zn-dependent metalloprotease